MLEHEPNGYLENDPNIPTSQHPVLSALQERLATLEKSIESKNDLILHWQGVASANQNAKVGLEQNLRSVITDLYNQDKIDKYSAEKILEECSIEATKTVAFSGAITFSGSVEVSLFEDEDDIRYNADINNLDISVFGNDIYDLDYEVDEVQVDSVS